MKKALLVVCIVCTVVNVICAIAVGSNLGDDKAKLAKQVTNLENTNKTLSTELDNARDLNSEYSSRISTLETENREYKKKADFMDQYIKVVEDDGQKTYHKYGCSYFDDSSFWAYNESQVVGQEGYTRCPYCN